MPISAFNDELLRPWQNWLLRTRFSNTPLVLPWPLKIGLELATRALLDPGDQSSVDFSRPTYLDIVECWWLKQPVAKVGT
jgi:hypothetical protein